MEASTLIDKRAAIGRSAKIGPGTRVGPFAVIEDDVVIGRDCRIESHAVIKRWTRLGDGNRVCEGAVLGGVPQDLKFQELPSGVEIGNRNIFREGVTVNRCTQSGEVTRVGDDNYLMTNSHVAHECRLASRIVLANNVALAGHVELEELCFLSGGVVVHQFSRIGKLAMVGGNAKVTRDVLPFFLADGVPAQHRGLNLVGLRRAGFSRDEVSSLKKAYRLLADRNRPLASKITALSTENSPAAQYLADFLQRSQRGFSNFGREHEA